jgi:pentapeptide MXKDX repeat protein
MQRRLVKVFAAQPTEKEPHVIKTAVTALALGLALAGGSAFADDMAKDKMGMEKDSMKKDSTKKKSAMKKDKMHKDAMEKDAMKKDSMAR